MLKKLNIEHKYTRVRRPQTNGKIERFWRKINFSYNKLTRSEFYENFPHNVLDYYN